MTFLDSNVLVYAVDTADRRKHAIALDILAEALTIRLNVGYHLKCCPSSQMS